MRSLLAFLSLASAQAVQFQCVYNVTIPRWARLNVGDSVCDGDVALTLHPNKFLLERYKTEDSTHLLWAAFWGNTGFTGLASYAHVADGELSIIELETGNVLWATNTTNSGASTFIVDKQGFWAMHAQGRLIWRAPALPVLIARPDEDRTRWTRLVTATLKEGSGLFSGVPTKAIPIVNSKLYPDKRLTAKDGSWLVYQMDGNIVLHQPNGTAVWDAGCSSPSPQYVLLHGDGTLQAYNTKNAMYYKSSGSRSEQHTFLLVVGNGQVQILQGPATAVGPESIWRKP